MQRALVSIELGGDAVRVGLAVAAAVRRPGFGGPDDVHHHHAPDARDQTSLQARVRLELAARGRGLDVGRFVPRGDVALGHRRLAGHEARCRHTQVAVVHAALVPAVGRAVLAIATVVVVAVRASCRQNVRRVALYAPENGSLDRNLVLEITTRINLLEWRRGYGQPRTVVLAFWRSASENFAQLFGSHTTATTKI